MDKLGKLEIGLVILMGILPLWVTTCTQYGSNNVKWSAIMRGSIWDMCII